MERIKGFEDYFIDRDGNVYNKDRSLKKYSIDRGGYKVVFLCVNGKTVPRLVHRLVALTFIPKTNDYVNHINGDKLDNRVENLEWCSAKYNAMHRDKMYPNMYDHKKIKVRCIETGEVYDSMKDVARKYNLSIGNLKTAIINKYRFGKYHYEYV